MNNMTLVQLIELNRRAAGYPPSHVRLPETTPKAAKKVDESEMIALLHKWKTQMLTQVEKGGGASGN